MRKSKDRSSEVVKSFMALLCIFVSMIIIPFGHVLAVESEALPKKREHIRIFRNFGVKHEILRNGYDLSFRTTVKECGDDCDPDHIALQYALSMTMAIQTDKSEELSQWLCETEGLCNIPADWICRDMASCDIPEEIFLHFSEDIIVDLRSGNGPVDMLSCTARGWDPLNDTDGNGRIDDREWDTRINRNASARAMHEARVPAYYWGPYWNLYCGSEVSGPLSNFNMNVGSDMYRRFMAEKHVPGIFEENPIADGIFFDTAQGYLVGKWIKEPGMVEFRTSDEYLSGGEQLFQSIKAGVGSDKIIIGNEWMGNPGIIDGLERENWLNITDTINTFEEEISTVKSNRDDGAIQLIQFNPIYHEEYAPNSQYAPVAPVMRERDQIYALATYYLVAGTRSYFAYGVHPYADTNGNLFIQAVNVDIGVPLGDYYRFSQYGAEGENLLENSNFEELQSGTDNPKGWDIVAEPVRITTSGDCNFNGKCARISSTVPVNNINSQLIELEPNTTYTLSGYIRTENITGGGGADIYSYEFDDAEREQCKKLTGENDWTYTHCTFKTGSDTNGRINFRIQDSTGTAWFDNIELRKGLPSVTYARKYSKALVLVRPRANDNEDYGDPLAYELNNVYRRVYADESMSQPLTSVTLRSGEAAILSCTSGDGDEYVAGSDCVKSLPPAPVLVSPTNNQYDLAGSVTLRWNQPMDRRGGNLENRLVYCTNEDLSVCKTIIIAPSSAGKIYYAGISGLLQFAILGFIAGGRIMGRRRITLTILVLLVAGGVLMSCGGGGSGESGNVGISDKVSEEREEVSDVSYTLSGLKSGTTYYWKVSSDNGEGTADSEIWSFTTR